VRQMGSLEVQVLRPGESKPVALDISSEGNAFEIFQWLGVGGWVIVKNVMDVTAKTTADDIRSNEVLRAILRPSQKDGEYRCTWFRNRSFNADTSRELWRRPGWETLAAQIGVGVIYLHAMGGKETEYWGAEYDTACRNEDSGNVAQLELAGRDLLFVPGWLRFKYPVPLLQGKQLNMAVMTLNYQKDA